MSTYVLMRILESAPRRYDLGMRMLTLGRLEAVLDRLAGFIEPGDRVMDLGCGTGALTIRAARRGARVKAIDVNPQMLEIAEHRLRAAGLADGVELEEVGVAELDREPRSSYDVVTSSLCLSELSSDEIDYTLGEVRQILRPGGRLLIAEEVRPRGVLRRSILSLLRLPLAALTWVLTQQTSHPLSDLAARLEKAGFVIEITLSSWTGGFVELVARRPAEQGS